MTLKELREKRARQLAEARAILDALPDTANDTDRADADRRFDAAMTEHDKTDKEIEQRERLERAEGVEQRQRETQAEIEARNRRPGSNTQDTPAAAAGERPSLRSAYRMLLLNGFGGVSSDVLAALEERGVTPGAGDSNAPELRALTTGTGSSGGFAVPTEFLPIIEKTMAIWGPMLNASAIDLLTTESGGPIEFPSIDDTARRGSLFAENAEITDDAGEDPVFGQVTLASYMHNSEIVKVPIQLLGDSAFDVENRLMPDLFGERMARTANDKLTTGTGSSQPQGIVTGAGAGVTAAAVAAFAADELIDLQHSVNYAYRQQPKAAWMFNDTVLKMARKLKDSENRYIWQAPDLKTGAPATLLDKPYWINPSMANPAASAKSILFGDLSKFMVRRVGGFTIFVFRERYMNNLQLGFMAFGRFDGRVINNGAIKVLAHPAS